jgi:murein L,D-transpeptidase YafK
MRVLLAGGTMLALALVLASVVLAMSSSARQAAWSTLTRLRGRHTVESRLQQLAEAEQRMSERCRQAGVAYPPSAVTLVMDKRSRTLHVLAQRDGGWETAATFPVTAASGHPGPKLREGDGQVPEGVYAIESLNPNSMFHLALRVGYPNEFDRARATEDGRTELGGDIMVHGGAASIGCIAIGDPAIEEVFALVARTGVERTRIIIAPCVPMELAATPAAPVAHANAGAPEVAGGPGLGPSDAPPWLPQLHEAIRGALRECGLQH